MKKILIADDHHLMIDGLRSIIDPNLYEVVATASTGGEVIQLIQQNEIDLVIMDINMPEMNGIEATKYIKSNYNSIRVLIVSMHRSSEYILQLMQIGADGYIFKNSDKNELNDALNELVNGRSYFPHQVTDVLINSTQKVLQEKKNEIHLTKREKEIMLLIAKEMTSPEIADQLFISIHTVETHRKNLISKLGVRSSIGIIKYAIEKGHLDA